MNYSREEIVSASKCDMKANLSLVGAVQIIQDNVCYYFGELGIDQIYMKNKFNVVWFYAKNKIEFYKNLHWNDTFRVKCFISKITPITMVVDTVFVNKNKKFTLLFVKNDLLAQVIFYALKGKKMDFNKKIQDFTKKILKKWQKHTDKLQQGVLNIIEGHKIFFRYFYFVVLFFSENTRDLANSVLYDFTI